MKKTTQNMIANIYSNLNNVFLDDDNKAPTIPIDGSDLNEEFFIATLIAFKMQFEALTHDKKDIIEFTHMLNSLAIQFVMNKDK